MKIYIVTQNFPPKIGGIQIVMLSLAKSFSELGYDVQVLQDHCYLKKESFKTKSFKYPKIFRSYAKKFFLKLNGNVNDLIICDTWKSLKAIPRKF